MIDAEERVVLVDEDDRDVGTMDKLEAHVRGERHRAMSVFVFDGVGRVLLQRRAAGKYHSPGRWTNSCCGHPRVGEEAMDAARRRLFEEMGIDVALAPVARFTYRADVGEGLVEHEVDHVFAGRFDGEPSPDPAEVDGWRWVAPEAVNGELAAEPERFTRWFPFAWRALRDAGGIPRAEGTGRVANS
jgi:isopentenyl-diphosphate delta-isomerase